MDACWGRGNKVIDLHVLFKSGGGGFLDEMRNCYLHKKESTPVNESDRQVDSSNYNRNQRELDVMN